MSIQPDDVARIAELARLSIEPADRARVAAQLTRVLAFAESLSALDLEGCEPASLAPAGQPLRRDASDGRVLGSAVATAAAPEAEGGFFLVPPIVDTLEP